MIYSGERLNSAEALRIGLLDMVVLPEELLPKAKAMAATIASKAPLAVAYAKRCIVHGANADLTTALEYEAVQFGLVCATEDSKEGCNGFLEKRKPEWKNK